MLSLKRPKETESDAHRSYEGHCSTPQECKKCKWASLVALELTHLGYVGVWLLKPRTPEAARQRRSTKQKKQKQVASVRVWQILSVRCAWTVYCIRNLKSKSYSHLVNWFVFLLCLSTHVSRRLVSFFVSPLLIPFPLSSLLARLIISFLQTNSMLLQASTKCNRTDVLNATMDQGIWRNQSNEQRNLQTQSMLHSLVAFVNAYGIEQMTTKEELEQLKVCLSHRRKKKKKCWATKQQSFVGHTSSSKKEKL